MNRTFYSAASGFTLRSPVCLNKASSAENNLQQQQADFYSTLTKDYAQQFAGQQGILNAMNSIFMPILQAGPGQKGFTPAEEASLRTGASDQIANAYQNAEKTMNNSLGARGGGNSYLPSGAEAQLTAGLASQGAAANASAQNQLTQENYAQGLSNFYNAANALSGVSAQMNPLGYADVGNTAGKNAFQSAYDIAQQNSGWASTLGGILGGAASSFLGGPLGASVLGGGGNNNSNSNSGGDNPFIT